MRCMHHKEFKKKMNPFMRLHAGALQAHACHAGAAGGHHGPAAHSGNMKVFFFWLGFPKFGIVRLITIGFFDIDTKFKYNKETHLIYS